MSDPVCKIGEVLYQGYCVPSYFTQEEKDAYVAQQKAAAAKSKKSQKTFAIVGVIVAIVCAVLLYVNVAG